MAQAHPCPLHGQIRVDWASFGRFADGDLRSWPDPPGRRADDVHSLQPGTAAWGPRRRPQRDREVSTRPAPTSHARRSGPLATAAQRWEPAEAIVHRGARRPPSSSMSGRVPHRQDLRHLGSEPSARSRRDPAAAHPEWPPREPRRVRTIRHRQEEALGQAAVGAARCPGSVSHLALVRRHRRRHRRARDLRADVIVIDVGLRRPRRSDASRRRLPLHRPASNLTPPVRRHARTANATVDRLLAHAHVVMAGDSIRRPRGCLTLSRTPHTGQFCWPPGRLSAKSHWPLTVILLASTN